MSTGPDNPFSDSSSNPNEPRADGNPYVSPENRAQEPSYAESVANEPVERLTRPYQWGWSVVLSWIVISVVTLGLCGVVARGQLVSRDAAGDADQVQMGPVNMQAKTMLGAKLAGGAETDDTAAIEALNTGQVEQRYAYAILVNEYAGPDLALEKLEEIDADIADLDHELTDNQQRVRAALGELFEDYSIGGADSSFLGSEGEYLEEHMGWVGSLARYPENAPDTDARKSLETSAFFAIMKLAGMGMLIMFLGVVGFGMLIGLSAMGSNKKLRRQFPQHSGNGHIYAETFAIWMLLFVAMQVLAGLVIAGRPQPIQMLATVFIFFGSLSALCWAIFRGVPMSELRDDIGLRFNSPIPKMLKGLMGYLGTLPVLVLGFVAMMMIQMLITAFAQHHPLSAPIVGHPIQEEIASGKFLTLAYVFFTACIAAPIVEETMFRGVLFRHLRDMTAPYQGSIVWSIFLSAVINSFVFAAIHPQGLLGIPVLMILAIGFSLVREWQNSLVAPMFMHFVHNFLVTCFAMTVM